MTQAPPPINTAFSTATNRDANFATHQATQRPSNTLGLIGFILSCLGLLTCCLPYVSLVGVLGLIISSIALFKAPRGFAIAGTALGLIATLIALFWVVMISLAGAAVQGVGGLKQFFGAAMVAGAVEEFKNNKGSFPPDLGALPVPTEWRNDKWGEPFHYEVSKDGSSYSLRSNGPDKVPGTPDDIDFTQFFDGRSPPFGQPPAPSLPAPPTPPDVPQPPATPGPDRGPV